MKRLALTAVTIMTLLSSMAQECSSLWLSCPVADAGQHVLYARRYENPDSIAFASAVVAATGYYKLYVNGMLLSTPPYPLVRAYGCHYDDSTAVTANRFDVTRYINAGENTIAVLCAPAEQGGRSDVSLCLSIENRQGETVNHMSDGSWLCCPVGSRVKDGFSEIIDSNHSVSPLDTLFADGIINWTPADVSCKGFYSAIPPVGEACYDYVDKVIRPKYFSVDSDYRGVVYDFGNGFYGLLRVTIRGARKGQRMNIAGSEYVCNGTNDEQFVLRFAASWFRRVYITGDSRFDNKMIEKVEGLQIMHN